MYFKLAFSIIIAGVCGVCPPVLVSIGDEQASKAMDQACQFAAFWALLQYNALLSTLAYRLNVLLVCTCSIM